jgi:putative transposase
VVGKNKDWKNEVNLGKVNNQHFVSIPFNKLISQLKYKGEEVGITVQEVSEPYTSKCSFLDLEEMKHQIVYLGKRIKRGLFRSAKGLLINADVNAAFNMIRKVTSNVFKSHEVQDLVINPVKVSLCF